MTDQHPSPPFHAAGNMHMHTPYSDGEKYHEAIAHEAIAAGLDFIIVTDHNIWVDGLEGVVENERGKVLMLVGEEVHNPRREPQASHLLCYGAERELSQFAADAQTLIDQVNKSGGICFLAHPHDKPMPLFGGIPDLGWHDWPVKGYAGIELWNYMSSFVNELSRLIGEDAADNLSNRLRGLPVALAPEKYITGPEPETLQLWDNLLKTGQKVSALGNSDVHGTPMSLGPIKREIFPYEFCFRAVNTHLELPEPLTGELAHDKRLLLTALKHGHGWVGYDMPHRTVGFRFSAESSKQTASMGSEIRFEQGMTLTAKAPTRCKMRLIRHGRVVNATFNDSTLAYQPDQPGAYRIECLIPYHGKERGWIYSNPIYVTE